MDLTSVANKIKQRIPLREIIHDHTNEYIKFHRGIEKLCEWYPIHRTWRTELFIYWGVPGTGKSEKAKAEYPDYFPKSTTDRWWDGYRDQETVLIDDFYGNGIEYEDMLKLADSGRFNVPIKGGYVPFLAKRIIITSNQNPKKWYRYWDALERRITSSIEFVKDASYNVKSPTDTTPTLSPPTD